MVIPLFTVVIPLYNKERYISRALESVLGQTYSDFECIVVDDGSTDGSLEIVNGFSDERIRVISKVNGGVSSARNRGLQEAQGKYVAFLDADDYWAAEYLSEMSALINALPNLGLYFSSHYVVKSDLGLIAKASPELADVGGMVQFNLFEYFHQHRNYGWSLHTSCCIVDKSVALGAGGFDERISFYEDYDLFARIALRSDFGYLNNPLTYYSCDVPADQRLTGKRPDISKHWVNYILDGKLASCNEPLVQSFVQNFAVFLLQGYRRSGQNPQRVAEVRKLIALPKLRGKSIIWFLCPACVSNLWTSCKAYLGTLAGRH